MPRSLKFWIVVVVALSAVALGATTILVHPNERIAVRWVTSGRDGPVPIEIAVGILFWTAVTLVASALPVVMPRGTRVAVSIAPIVAAIVLGGPTVAGWVAAVGSTEV